MNYWIAAVRTYTLKATSLAAVIFAFSVAPLYSQSDTISGLVVALDGTPMAGIQVKAKPEGTNSAGLPTVVTKTDSSGQYRFEGIPSGAYVLHAEPEGGRGATLRTNFIMSVRIFIDDAVCELPTGKCSFLRTGTSAIPILMGPARVTVPDSANTGFDIVMLPTAVEVSGHLTIPAGITLPPLRAALTPTRSQETMDSNVHTDGTFEIPNVVPGTYVLRIVPNLGIPPRTIIVTDKDQTGIELGKDLTGVRVGGHVMSSDRPESQDTYPQWVYLIGKDASEVSPSSQSPFLQLGLIPNSVYARVQPPPPMIFADESGAAIEAPVAPVGSDGRFEFLSVPRGSYYLRTLPEMGIPNFPVTVGDTAINDVRAGSGVRVRGDIVSLNLGTRPPELIRLTATEIKGQSVSADVKADGSFEFPKVGPGTYQVLLDNKIRPRPAEVTIGEEDLIFRVEAPFKVWVAGRVVFAGSIPPAELLSGLRVGMNNGYDSEVKPDGSFQIKSNEGEYEFFLRNLPESCVVKSISDGSVNLLVEPVKVDLSSPPREILVTLEYKPVPAQ